MDTTDEEIAAALRALYKKYGRKSSFFPFHYLVEKLQARLGHDVDLSGKLDFIRDEIHRLLPACTPRPPPVPVAPLVLLHPSPTASRSLRPVKRDLPAQPAEKCPPAKQRGGPGGLQNLCLLSQELQGIVGQPTMSRTEITKQLWAYIKSNSLQDPANKKKILCDDKLRLVFQADHVDMRQMNKLLVKHISPIEPPEVQAVENSPQPSGPEADPGDFPEHNLEAVPHSEDRSSNE